MHAAPLALVAAALLATPAATQTRDRPAVAPTRAIEFPDVPGAVTLVVGRSALRDDGCQASPKLI